MYILCGLGNPGANYAGNRHNVGFMAVDLLSQTYGFSVFTKKFNGLLAEGRIGESRVLAFKPQTYMNLSGEAVGALLRFYKLTPSALTVLHDELDLAPGRLKVKTGGGHGGHNGLKSIDAHIGQEYTRVRLGIGHPGVRELVSPYVLSDFPRAEQALVQAQLQSVARHAPLLLAGDQAGFMNQVSRDMQPLLPAQET